MTSRTVLLCGCSLLLSGVAAGLRECSDLDMTQAATWEEACRLLADRIPDVLIFDLAGACESYVLPLPFKHPDLLLIGLDAEYNRAVLVSGQEIRSFTLNEIKEIAAGNDLRVKTGGNRDRITA
jgi:hypothetical protein